MERNLDHDPGLQETSLNAEIIKTSGKHIVWDFQEPSSLADLVF